MATVEKRGSSYRIRASSGYTVKGKQVRPSITWTPEPGMTERQIEKALTKQAALFDDQVSRGAFQDNRIKFEAFAEIFMEDYGNLHLRPKTRKTYKDHLEVINAAIGHIRLCELKVTHINKFYKNLQEEGVKAKEFATCKIDLNAWLKANKLSVTQLAAWANVSRSVVTTAAQRGHISRESADKLAEAMGRSTSSTFAIGRDMTPLAPGSVLAYHRTLSSILGKAVKWGYIGDNPAHKAEKPSQKHSEAPYLEEDDARRLLELLQEEPIRWRALLSFDLLSGLRRAELLGLRWCDVNFFTSTITIRKTLNYLPELGVYEGEPKTDKSERPLHISTAGMGLLMEYKHWQDAQRELLGDAWENSADRVFTTETGAQIFPDGVTQWFTKFVQRSGLPPVTVHSLRHTYATLMIADGRPVVAVSHQLGHANASTTEKIYAHAIASAQARAAETFDRFNDVAVRPMTEAPKKKKAAGA